MTKMIAVVEPATPDSDPHSYHIKVLRGEFAGVTYKFGDVSISEENDDGKLHFSYNVIEGDVSANTAGFEKFIGDQLIAMIEEQLRDQTIVFKGGV